MRRQSTQEHSDAQIHLTLHDRRRNILENIDQFLLYCWEVCEEVILLSREQDVRQSSDVQRPQQHLIFTVCEYVC
jgi:hypothetical protein